MSWHLSWLVVAVLAGPALAAVCPESCVCSTTRDGLHRAACSDLTTLYKFTLRQKHHNINILDLSHNNITKLTHELDRLTEVVTLDLSTNGITQLKKFLYNAKKLVHLNLANNRIKRLSLTHLPTSVSSLDLTNNLLQDVPFDLEHLKSLEHLEMEGNPLDCSCDNIMARDRLLSANVFIDNAICSTPPKLKGRSWLELKTKDICKVPRTELSYLDMMMGDEPVNALQIGEDTTALKSMPLTANSDLEDGHVIKEGDTIDDDDSLLFMKVNRPDAKSSVAEIEGSGEPESTPAGDVLISPKHNWESRSSFDEPEDKTEDPTEGSGEFPAIFEGSGFSAFDENHEKSVETTTVFRELYTGPVTPIVFDESNTSEIPTPKIPSLYKGGQDWNTRISTPDLTETADTSKSSTTPTSRDTTVSEHIRVNSAAEINESPSSSEKPAPHKTGTYVCIAIIVVLLVGLIGFAIVKGQIRKRRDRRLLRQQKRDVEQASKELVDMNKSLLGKAAVIDTPIEKKLNGKYELVPTHEKLQKTENGDLGNGIKSNGNGVRNGSPRDTNQNKSSSLDNNLFDDNVTSSPVQDTSFDSTQPSTDSKKDTHSLSSEDIFVPLNDDDTPRVNGTTESDISQPLLNGDMSIDTDFLSPREYIPVYSPDMGRVRIKLSETPKPKTPVLVTRSRSNAGDIIITPSLDASAPKSTT